MDNRAALALASLGLVGAALFVMARARRAAAAAGTGATDALAAIAEQARAAFADIVRSLTPGPWTLPDAGEPYRDALAHAEAENAIPQNLLARQLDIESQHFSADVVSGARLSRTGAIGIAQFMPATAAELRVDPRDPFASIAAAGRYMAYLYRQLGDWRSALAAYNWGIGNVQRKGLGAAPAETRDYVAAIAGVILV